MNKVKELLISARERLWRPSVGIIAIVVLFGGWYLFVRDSGTKSEFLTVKEGTFAQEIYVSGNVEAASTVDLGFSQSGRVSRIYVEVGDIVRRGAILAEIENGDLRANVAQREAALASQRAKLTSLQDGTRPEQIAVSEAQVDSDIVALGEANRALVNAVQSSYTVSDTSVRNTVDQFFSNPNTANPEITFGVTDSAAEAKLESNRVFVGAMLRNWLTKVSALSPTNVEAALMATEEANSNLSSVASLLSDSNAALTSAITSGGISQSNINTWISAVGTARTSVNTSISALSSALSAQRAAATALTKDQKTLALQRAGSTKSDIDAQVAAVASAEAELQNTLAQLEKTIVRAPFAGTVTRVDAKVGSIISPNTPEISMISTGIFRIVTYVPEVDIAQLAVGNMATTTLDAYGPTVYFPATVVAIDPAETVVGGISTYKTTLQFLEKDERVRSGMTASVRITTALIPNTIAIPQSALISESGGTFVQVESGDEIEKRAVTIGRSSGIGNVEITSGLIEGEKVVLNPSI